MNSSIFANYYREISSLLNKDKIQDALSKLTYFLENNDAEASALASFRTLQSALSQFTNSSQENPDPDAHKENLGPDAHKENLGPDTHKENLDLIYREVWQLLDQLRWQYMEHPPLIFAVDNLEDELEPEHLSGIDDYHLGCIFNTIRTTYPISKSQRNALHRVFLSDQVSVYLRATLLSALTLNMLEWFDADLLECMYTYTLDDQPKQLRQQAWTTLFLCGMVHDSRILHYPRLSEEYLLLCEIEPSQLEHIQEHLLPLREHEAFKRKIRDLLDKVDDAERKMGKNDNDPNLLEFMELMNSNFDSGYAQFRSMTGLPFFNQSGTDHHWLMPFDEENEVLHKVLTENPELKSWYQLICNNIAQTNTDKYSSFLFMKDLLGKFTETTEQVNGLIQEGKVQELGADMIMKIHLQDLYRFYTLSKTGKELQNPFLLSPDLGTYRCFGNAFDNAKILRHVAEFFLKYKRYDDAAETYLRLLKHEVTEQNLKNCYLCMYNSLKKDYKTERIDLLLKCNKLYPGNEDTLTKLLSYVFIGCSPEMDKIIEEAVEYFPNSTDFLIKYAYLLHHRGRDQEATNMLYKAFMIDETNIDIIYEIANFHEKLGEYEKAQKILEHVPKKDNNES